MCPMFRRRYCTDVLHLQTPDNMRRSFDLTASPGSNRRCPFFLVSAVRPASMSPGPKAEAHTLLPHSHVPRRLHLAPLRLVGDSILHTA